MSGARSFPDGLPVRLGIEIAELVLTLGDVLDLAPGAVVEVPLAGRETVTLALGATPVAEARIVSEGEQYFLEIVKIFPEAETGEDAEPIEGAEREE